MVFFVFRTVLVLTYIGVMSIITLPFCILLLLLRLISKKAASKLGQPFADAVCFWPIFLLSGGKPLSLELSGNAGYTDLLITWLYKMTVSDTNYKLAAVMGILVFLVCAVINLIVYNMIPSVKNEEDFQ